MSIADLMEDIDLHASEDVSQNNYELIDKFPERGSPGDLPKNLLKRLKLCSEPTG
jgi:hypothetical protein